MFQIRWDSLSMALIVVILAKKAFRKHDVENEETIRIQPLMKAAEYDVLLFIVSFMLLIISV